MNEYEAGDIQNIGGADFTIFSYQVNAGDYPMGQIVSRTGTVDRLKVVATGDDPTGVIIRDYGTLQAGDWVDVLVKGTYNRSALMGVGGNAVTGTAFDQPLQNAGIYLRNFK